MNCRPTLHWCVIDTWSCQWWLHLPAIALILHNLSLLLCVPLLCVFIQEYEPTIYHPKRSSHSLHQDFTVQCEKMDIPFLSYLPTEVDTSTEWHLFPLCSLTNVSSWPCATGSMYPRVVQFRQSCFISYCPTWVIFIGLNALNSCLHCTGKKPKRNWG